MLRKVPKYKEVPVPPMTHILSRPAEQGLNHLPSTVALERTRCRLAAARSGSDRFKSASTSLARVLVAPVGDSSTIPSGTTRAARLRHQTKGTMSIMSKPTEVMAEKTHTRAKSETPSKLISEQSASVAQISSA